MAKDNLEKFGALGVKVSDDDLEGLSWNDKLRLKERGKLTEAQERRHGFYPIPGLGGSHETPRSARRSAPEPETETVEEGEEPEDYNSWSKADLVAEIDERNANRDSESQLTRTGSKDHLISVLQEDDEAQVEEGEG